VIVWFVYDMIKTEEKRTVATFYKRKVFANINITRLQADIKTLFYNIVKVGTFSRNIIFRLLPCVD